MTSHDLDLCVKVTGTFVEPMELENFPMDLQRLTMTISMTCRNEVRAGAHA